MRLSALLKKIRRHLSDTDSPFEGLVEKGLQLGQGVHFGEGVVIDPDHCFLISIGDGCTLAPNVHLLAHDASTKKLIGYTRIGRVTLEPYCFIGAGSIILPGVRIGKNSVIGAGSVVTHDIPEGSVAAGNPARVVRTVSEYAQKHEEEMRSRPRYPAEWTAEFDLSEDQIRQMRDDLKDGFGYIE